MTTCSSINPCSQLAFQYRCPWKLLCQRQCYVFKHHFLFLIPWEVYIFQPPMELDWSQINEFWPVGCDKDDISRPSHLHISWCPLTLPSRNMQCWRPHVPDVMATRWRRASSLTLDLVWVQTKHSKPPCHLVLSTLTVSKRRCSSTSIFFADTFLLLPRMLHLPVLQELAQSSPIY